MQPWLDFLMLACALSAGWLGWVALRFAGWSPARALRPVYGLPSRRARGLAPRRDP